MSHVTNIILCASAGEFTDDDSPPVPIVAINDWMATQGYGILTDIAAHGGGTKEFECLVYGGAFNYLALSAWAAVVCAQPWESPEDVQVLVQEQDDTRFTFYTIADLARLKEAS